MIHQNVIRHLNRATIRRGLRAPMTHHVIIRIERRSHADGHAFNRSDTEADGIAGNDTGGIANRFAHDRAGVIWTGVAVISAGAAGEQQAGKQ